MKSDPLREAWLACAPSKVTGSRDLVLDSLDLAFGLDSWMNMREQLRLSPVHASPKVIESPTAQMLPSGVEPV